MSETARQLAVGAERQRIAAALRDLRETELRCRHMHYSDCLCGALAARTIAALTGEERQRD